MLGILLRPFDARSDKVDTIVVSVDESVPVAERICLELNALGYDTTVAELSKSDPDSERLKTIVREEQSLAVIRVDLANSFIEVFVALPETSKDAYRYVELNSADEPVQSIVVLASVELLRATIDEVLFIPDEPKEEPVVEKAIPKEENHTADRLSGNIGLGPTFIGKGAGVHIGMSLGVHFRVFDELHFGLLGVVPIIQGEQSVTGGSVQFAPGLIGAELLYMFRDKDQILRPFLGAGFSVAIYSLKGNSDTDYTSSEIVRASGMPVLRGGAVLKLSKRVHLDLFLLAGISPAEHTVLVLDEATATVGKWWLSFMLETTVVIWQKHRFHGRLMPRIEGLER